MGTSVKFDIAPVIEEEGTPVVQNPNAMNFVGTGVTVTEDPTGTAKISVPGGVHVKDEGSTILNPAAIVDFVGTGVTVTENPAGTAKVSIPGGVQTKEGGVSLLNPALALNFNANDFNLTDEGSSVAGIAFNHSAATNQMFPCDASFGAGQTYGSYSLLRVYLIPVWIEKQLGITKIYINASANGFVAGADHVALGLFDETGARVFDSCWIGLGVAGNYGNTVVSVNIPRRIRGWFGISWRAAMAGTIWGRSYGTPTIRPFMNAGNGLVMYGTNSCSDLTELRAITGAANNGSGLIRISCSGGHTFITGDKLGILGVGGVTNANMGVGTAVGTPWTVTVINSTTFDLQSSVFAGSYTSGGKAWKATDPAMPATLGTLTKEASLATGIAMPIMILE